MSYYIFYRPDGFYPLEFESDEEAIASAKRNPGTIKVTKITSAIIDETVFESEGAE